jgi:pimeloyl-ACP methyl ester carboxylesterase
MIDALAAPLVRELIYPRRGTRVPVEATTYALDVGAATLRGWVVNPGRDRALVYFGGNGERLDPWQDVLADRFPGHTSYLLAYRGYGASDGRPTEPALGSDALALVDHVSARHAGVDVMGRSLGSAVAVLVAARRTVEHLVLVTPFDSLSATAADLFPGLPVRELVADRWDSAAIAADVRAPVLVLRAGADVVVRPARTDALIEALDAPVVVSFDDAEHDSISDEPGYWPAVVEFLDPGRVSRPT